MYPHPFNPAPSNSRNHMSSPAHSFETFDVGRSLTTVLGVTRDVGNKIFRVSSKMGRKSHSASVKEVSVLWISLLFSFVDQEQLIASDDQQASNFLNDNWLILAMSLLWIGKAHQYGFVFLTVSSNVTRSALVCFMNTDRIIQIMTSTLFPSFRQPSARYLNPLVSATSRASHEGVVFGCLSDY